MRSVTTSDPIPHSTILSRSATTDPITRSKTESPYWGFRLSLAVRALGNVEASAMGVWPQAGTSRGSGGGPP